MLHVFKDPEQLWLASGDVAVWLRLPPIGSYLRGWGKQQKQDQQKLQPFYL